VATAYPRHAIVAQLIALREDPDPIDVPMPPAVTIRSRLGALGQRLAAAQRNEDYPKRPPKAAACRELGCGYITRCWRD
jgi:hypothetical protein